MSKNRTLILIAKEIRDIFRDWRLSLPVVSFALGFPFLMLIGIKFLLITNIAYYPGINMPGFYLISLLVVCFFPSSLTVVIALESFVGERERQTLESLLLTPMKDKELYFGKLFASLLLPFSLGIVSFLIYIIYTFLFLPYRPTPSVAFLILALVFIKSLVLVSGASVISSQAKTIRAANLSATIIILPVTLLLGLESHCLLNNKIGLLWILWLELLIYALLFIRIGLKIFRRENMLIHETEFWGWKGFWNLLIQRIKKAWNQENKRLIPWLYQEIKYLLADNKFNLIMMSIFLIIAFWVGYFYSAHYLNISFPYNIEEWKDMEREYKIPKEFTPGRIVFHNLRAILITLIFSPLTFGASAIAFILVPGIIIGFLAGLVPEHSFKSILGCLKHLLPHGIFEIPAAILTASFIFRIGTVLLITDQSQHWIDNFLRSFLNFLKILIIVIPLFLIAAYLEVKF